MNNEIEVEGVLRSRARKVIFPENPSVNVNVMAIKIREVRLGFGRGCYGNLMLWEI